MSHTYATLDEFRGFLADSSPGTANDTRLLDVLEAASRAVDGFASRSQFGSGFGPRIGTNRYDGYGDWSLAFNDDLLAISTFKIYDATAASTFSTPTQDTDYYLRPYNATPYRELIFHGQGTVNFVTYGARTVEIAGTWGYQNTTASLGTAGTASSSATTLVLSGSPAAGMTLLVGSEHIYVQSVASGTATVLRAQNGSTAAAISAGAAVSYFTYPDEVKDATVRVAQRRWRARDAGLTGDFGGDQMGVTSFRDTEFAILRNTIGHLRVYGVG